MSNQSEYYDAMITFLEMIWGDGFMAPGGAGNVANLVEDLDIRDKRVLDIGCGLGGPACLLAGEYGAQVVGTDLESRLIDLATERAEKLNLATQTDFLVVEPGPLTFPDDSFDVVMSSGAFTQVENKLGMFTECLRVLKPGGTLTCYDWMKCDGEYSEDMLYWFKMEGLTYAMETPERYRELFREAGFTNVELRDRSEWFQRKVQEEYELIQSELHSQMLETIGRKDADHFVENWRSMVVICNKGEMLQVYSRARKPS
jgi:phosphoethanolamine N-methyltransferase